MAKKRNRNRDRAREHKMVSALDDLEEFRKFREQMLPVLRKALDEEWSAEEIYEKAEALAAARTVNIALTEPDSTKALAAVKDILDRTKGKPTERREIKHQYDGLKDEELDALVMSELGHSEEDGNPTSH